VVDTLSTDPVRTPTGLVDLLIDDAAVFPPGLAPLDEAVPAFRRIRASALHRYVGPFLLPAGAWREVLPLLDDESPIPLVLICRRDDAADPTDPAGDLASAVRGLARAAGVHVVGVEVAMPAGVTDPTATLAAVDALVAKDQAVTVEIDGTDPDRALAALAALRHAGRRDLRGKFRTGGTRPQDSPDVAVLAEVIAATTGRRLPIKFTAGLHHAVTGNHGPGGSVQYGVLNVIFAVHRAAGADARAGSVPARRIVAALQSDDPDELAAQAISLRPDQVRAVRSVFTSFGCCGVTEPLAELTALGVIAPKGRIP
jgi:hypothetical protein